MLKFSTMIFAALLAGTVLASDGLVEAFTHPPDAGKPSGYWWWINANVDREGITRDLEQFKAKGMGGVLLISAGTFPSSGPVPRGPAFLSLEWRALFKHALAEANRLGLKVAVNICPGWNMGGPWVTPDKASRWMLQSRMNLVGPQHFASTLPLPNPRDGYDLPPQAARYYIGLPLNAVDYRDTAVLAFRTPQSPAGAGPAPRSDLPAKSNRFDGRCSIPAEHVMAQTLKPWAQAPEDVPIPVGDVVDLTARLRPDGTLDWDVPEGQWTIVRTGHRMTGAQLSVPMPGQGGLENDYLDRAGVELIFENTARILLEDAGPLAGKTLQSFCSDSFECGYPNWTANLVERFKQYRGYDPTPYLPVFSGWLVGSAEVSERFLHDYRKTVADCMADEHYGRFAELSHAKGIKTECEAAGPSWSATMCMDGLKNLGRCDFPKGEFWQNGSFVQNGQNQETKQTASAGHIYGRPIVSAEAFTSSKHFREVPGNLKPNADRAFCEGINRFVMTVMPCQRPQDGKPGYVFAAGIDFMPNITWWDQAARPWLAYVNRCQALLQSGLFVADVLYYNGDWAPNLVGPKKTDPSLGKGYDYDVCNAEVLLTRLSVKDGRIALPDGMSYRLLVLPESKRMPVEVILKLRQLVQDGATIVGPRPESDPGLRDYPKCDALVKTTAGELWGELDGKQATERAFGRGRVFLGKPLRAILRADEVVPDFECAEPAAFIDFIHRRTGEAEIYFLANRNNRPEPVTCRFRVDGKTPELWDPVTGEMRDLPTFTSTEDGRTEVPLSFEPDGSMFVVFRKGDSTTKDTKGMKNFPELKAAMEIPGPWTVQFDPHWFYPTTGLEGAAAQGTVPFATLEDWTQRSESAIKYYSGTAVYRKTFELKEGNGYSLPAIGKAGGSSNQKQITSPQPRVWLALGAIPNGTARVRLNGQDCGVVWCAPWQADITAAVRPGTNALEIEVVNLWTNRLIGDATLPSEQRRTRSYVTITSGLLQSGLLGPVRILAEEQSNPSR